MILKPLRQAVTGNTQTDVVCECRRCGTTVCPETRVCPACEATDIVHYDVS